MSFPTGWASQAALTVQHGQVTADQTGFPVLVTAASFATNCPEILTSADPHAAQSDGGDLRFSTDIAGANQIACDVVRWTQDATFANAKAEIWVPRDILTGSDVVIYVWWEAGGGVSQPAANASFGSQAVWDSNYTAVFHLETIGAHTAGTTPDSTANGNALINGGSSDVTTTAGVFSGGGNAGSFAGDNYFLRNASATGNPTGSTTYTLEGWFKRSANNAAQEFFGFGGNTGAGKRTSVFWQNDGKLYNEMSTNSATFPWTADTSWHYIVWTLPSGNTPSDVLGYLDGSPQTITATGGTINNENPGGIIISGVQGAAGVDGFFGLVDEVRISKIARSSTWIATQYNNTSAPSSFIISGTRQSTAALLGYFSAAAEPTAFFLGAVSQGFFAGTSDPRAFFTQGNIIFTASPLASFAPIDNAYSEMGFTGTAYPLLTLTPDATGIAFVVPASPQLMWFVPIGQSEHCASGTGVGTRDSTPTNYVF